MDHVAADHRVGAFDRPLLRGHVKMQRRQQVGDAGGGAMRGDAFEHFGIGIGRLPAQVGQVFRKIGPMLAAAAGDFEHQPLARQHVFQNFEDRLAVARDVREIEALVGCFGHPDLLSFTMIGVGLDRLDAKLFVLMSLSRICDRRRRRRFAPSLTSSSTRTQTLSKRSRPLSASAGVYLIADNDAELTAQRCARRC